MKTFRLTLDGKTNDAVQLEDGFVLILDEVYPLVQDPDERCFLPDQILLHLKNDQSVLFTGYGHYHYDPEARTYTKAENGRGVTYLNADLLATYMPLVEEVLLPEYYIKVVLDKDVILEWQGDGRYFTAFNGCTYTLIKQHPKDFAHYEYNSESLRVFRDQALEISGPHCYFG